MPASSRTLYWLNTTDADEQFGEATSWTTTEGSSTPATAPAPTSTDDTEIDTTATVSGSGSASVLNINAGVTVSGSLNTDITNRTTIGNSAAGSVTIGAGSSWTLSYALSVGGADNGQLTISGGGSLTTDADISSSSNTYDGIGYGAGTGSVTVTGAGSKWTSNAGTSLAVGPSGTLSITDGGEVQQTQESGGFFLGGGSMSVDSSSIAEAGTVGGAETGYLTIDPNNFFGGVGTFTGNIIDNGYLQATDAAGFSGNGTLTINGSITGTGTLTVGAQETLALNGPVSLTGGGSVSFYGWYGTLAIDDASGFPSSLPIYSFNPGDTIDLKNVPYDSSDSSYSFSYGPDGGANDLRITEGAQTYNLNVGTYYSLSGLLTLKPDASGTGTDIVYTSGGASPFQQWGSPLSNFFTTSSGPVDGSDWGLSNDQDGGQPIWIDTETPASTYVAGQSEPYTIVLTTQDWIGTEQPLLTVTTTNLVDPFSTGSSDVGNLAGSIFVSNNGSTGTMDLIYWQASATPGDYAVEFQPITTTYVSAPSTGPSTVLTGSPTQLDAAVSQPFFWTTADNGTSSSAATEGVLSYATHASATTEDIYLQGFSTAGVASTPVLAATVADGTWYSVSYNSGSFYYNYYTSTGASGAGLYAESFDPTTGALGSPSAYLLTPGLTSVSSESGVTLHDGTHLRFVEGFQNSQQVIETFVGNGSPSPVKTFDLGNATPDHYAIASVTDPNEGQTDYTVLAYTDDNQVHLELLNNYGEQIGSDYIVPGITSFDRLHTILGSNNNAYRVELDYTVPDPNGGTEIEGLIYDTSPTGDYVTLSGGGEYEGTPFDDTFIDAAGNYTINGGGGQDNFQINQDSDEVDLAFGSHHQLVVGTFSSTVVSPFDLTGSTTLIGFTNINLNDQSIVESTSAGGYTQLNVQDGSTFAGTVAGFAPGDAIAFEGVTYAPGDHAVFTSNGSGGGIGPIGGTVAIDNSGGTEVASFNVLGNYQSSQFAVSGGTGGALVVSFQEPPDILWRNSSTGGVELWSSNGSGGFTYDALAAVNTSWQMAATGDFNVTGEFGILWRNSSTGGVELWNSNGSGGFTYQSLNPVNTSWQVAGTGDFNGAGADGILWRNASTGGVELWNSNGLLGFTYESLSPVNTSWQVAGTGNFTGDGEDSILWRNSSTGGVELWNPNGSGDFTYEALAAVNTNWQIAGTGDFTGNGEDGIAWHNSSTGAVELWNPNGSGGFTYESLAPVNTNWQIVGTNDFTGNGQSGILWRNTTSGDTELWNPNGSGGFTYHDLGVVSTSWSVQKTFA
jgi:T5SS/PEP-CTERM-associated repeat protein